MLELVLVHQDDERRQAVLDQFDLGITLPRHVRRFPVQRLHRHVEEVELLVVEGSGLVLEGLTQRTPARDGLGEALGTLRGDAATEYGVAIRLPPDVRRHHDRVPEVV